jgi:asparagine synthase (glutamine-hydrolysing)
MPGIVGILGRNASEAKVQIDQMIGSMRHLSSYVTGHLLNEPLSATLGWTTHPKSFSDCMPVWNETRDVCLIWTGENFADASDLVQLRSRGHAFNAENAECLVHLYEEHGTKFLNRLNGWFSGVLLDLRESRIVLFNDRYGLGRIYYHESPDGFYFASEAKALLKVLPHLRELDLASMGEFFSCACPLQNRTLFKGVNLLPGGSAWVFSPEKKRGEENYFRPQVWLNQVPLGADEYYERLKDTFPRVLKRYFPVSQPCAVSLTGGVDSRMMMAWAPGSANVATTYTFSGIYRECHDVHLARNVAELCQRPHRVIRVGDQFLSEFPSLAERTVYLSDGMMDMTGAPDLYANRIAREIAPIRVTGNYGGEILRSLVAFKPDRLDSSLFTPDFRPQVSAAAQTYARELQGNPLAFIAFKQVPWHHYSRLSVEQSQLTLRSPYLDNDLVSLAFQVPQEHARTNELSLRLINDGNPKLGRMSTDRGIQYGGGVPGLSKLHNLFQEFTFKAEYAYDYGMPQSFVKVDRALTPLHLERLFLGRHKFYHFRVWYRNQLAPYLKEVLLDPRARTRPCINPVALERMVLDHTRGVRNCTRELHRALTFELLHRQLLEMQ